MLTTLTKIIATAALAVSTWVMPVEAEEPVDTDLYQAASTAASLPTLSIVSAPAPGREFTNMAKTLTCTFGFKAELNGDTGYLTAGHCGDVGDEVAITTLAGKRAVGEFTWSTGSPLETGGTRDLAFIKIDGYAMGNVERAGGTPIATLTRDAMTTTHPDLCKVGPKTGDACGITESESFGQSVVNFDAPSLHGDSGSPVFARTRGGDIVAVGILSGSPSGKPETIVAQLIDNDTLNLYGLSVSFS